MISYKEAYEIINNEFNQLELDIEIVQLEDANGRTLAENIFADINLPPFDNSAVDGIAIKFTPGISAWNVTDEVSAGNYKTTPGAEAVLIMTGAKVPPHFDTVIPLEDYLLEGEIARLKESISIKKGMNIRRKASDIEESEIVVSKNVCLTPRNIAAIAACGKSEIQVYKKIKIGVLATGDELISITEKPVDDKIIASNNYGLTAAVTSLNQIGINYGFINDDYDLTKNKISEMLNSDLDVIITTGGVSVGKYDFVKDIFMKLGVKKLFWRAYIKPGKPAFFGNFISNAKSKLIFGLPGNPVSCMVNFDVYIKPNIQAKLGMAPQTRIKARLLNDIRKKDNKRHFVKGNITLGKVGYSVSSLVSQSSGNLVGFSSSNCLIELEEDVLNPTKGDIVECIMI